MPEQSAKLGKEWNYLKLLFTFLFSVISVSKVRLKSTHFAPLFQHSPGLKGALLHLGADG